MQDINANNTSQITIVSNDGLPAGKRSRFQRFGPQLIAAMLGSMNGLSIGSSAGFPTILIPAVMESSNSNATVDTNTISMNDDEIAWLGSVVFMIMPFGCMISGSYAEFMGKRRGMQLLTIPQFISWMIYYFSSNSWHLILSACIIGMVTGLNLSSDLTYTADICEPQYRGMLSVFTSYYFAIALFIQYLLGKFIYWRTLALITSIVPVLGFIAFCFIPESPHWYIRNGKKSEAIKTLHRLRPGATSHQIASEYDEIVAFIQQTSTPIEATGFCERMGQAIQLLCQSNFLRPFGIIFFVYLVGNFCGKLVIQTFAIEIFKEINAPMDEFSATIILGLMEILALTCFICFIKRWGKRPMVLVSVFTCGFFMLVAATCCFYLKHLEPNDSMNSGISVTAMLCIFATVFCAGLGLTVVPYVYIGELYPTSVRNFAAGLSGGSGYFCSFLVTNQFMMMKKELSLSGTFYTYSGFALIGGIILYFIIPETEGKTLEEISNQFNKKHEMINKRQEITTIT